jgi:hypothetical protein
MTTLTKKQFQKLSNIEYSAKKYMWNMKIWDCESIVLQRKRKQWQELTEEFGIMTSDGETIRYKTECGKDYSHGYNFGDALA